jgi:signal transduction histidine kinase
MDIADLRQAADREAALVGSRSTTLIPGSESQPHGCVLVFERSHFTLVHASETAPRLLSIELPDSFGQSVGTLFGDKLSLRVRSALPHSHERRSVALARGIFDMHLIADEAAVLVELEPLAETVEPGALGALHDSAAAALAEAWSLRDIARIVCDRFAEATGFGLVALARATQSGVEIAGETRLGNVPSLYATPALREAVLELGGGTRVAMVADLTATPAQLLTAQVTDALEPIFGGAELLLPQPKQAEILRENGVVSVAMLPLGTGDRIWGHLIAAHSQAHRLAQAWRRFALGLGPLIAAAAERVETGARWRARRLAADAVVAFRQAVTEGNSPVEALLFGERLLASSAGADGVAILCGEECVVVGRGPAPETLVASLPALVGRVTARAWTTDRLAIQPGFTAETRKGMGGLMAVVLSAVPRIALVAFRQEQEPIDSGSAAPALAWETHRVEAFTALAAALREMLVASDGAAAAELSFHMAEFEQRALGAARLRSAIMESSTSAVALVSGRAPDPLRLVESNGMFRRLFGLEPQDLPAGTPDEIAQRLGIAAELLSDAGQAAVEIEIWSPELGPRIVEIDTRAIVRTRIAGHAADLTLLQVTDLTRIRRQEVAMRMARDQALALIRVRDEMLANMSHELRTPLNAVIGFAEMIGQEVLGPVGIPRYAGYARDIEGAGRHLLGLINDVLDLSRLSSGKQLADEAPVDLVELARSCLDWARVASPGRDLTLILDNVARSLPLRGDARALRQVLINLISNAIKFTGEGGHVGLRLALRMRGPVVIEITDDGIGMSPAELSRAFEPFFRGGGAYQRRIDGAGLGLAIAKGLMELHGGTLTLSSIEGRGTTARLELPAWRLVEGGS